MTTKGAGTGAGGGTPSDKKSALDAKLAEIEAAALRPITPPERAASGRKPATIGAVSAGGTKAGQRAAHVDPGVNAEPGTVAWPFGFVGLDDGLWHVAPGSSPEKPGPATWLCGPIDVRGLTRTDDGFGWGKVVTFCDPDETEKVLVIANADLVGGDGATVIKALASQGLAIAGRKAARDRLLEALAGAKVDRRITLRDRVGWDLAGKFFALPDETFGDGAHVLLEQQARGAHFAQAGSLDDWRAWIKALVADHDILVFFVALGLAAPFLDPLGAEGGGFHLVGPSSTGKSTALHVASSVWGGATYAQSWRATSNALEGVAAAHNDALLALDEIGLCDPRDVGIAAYVLSGGAGKQRMRSDGDLRALRRWRIAVASTGEIGLADKVGEDGRRAMAGQEIRLVDLRIDPSRASGVFNGSGAPEEFDALAKAIKRAAAEHFGTAGPAIVADLIANRDGLVRDARKLMADFAARYVPPGSDGQVSRAAARFALVSAAGEIATMSGILPFAIGRVSSAAGVLFENWVAARGGTGASEDRAAVVRIRDFIAVHGAARFQKLGISDESWRAQYQAGFRDAGFWLFSDAGFQEALAGLDLRAAATALAREGFLTRDGAHLKVKVTTPRGRHRYYKISNSICGFGDGPDSDADAVVGSEEGQPCP